MKTNFLVILVILSFFACNTIPKGPYFLEQDNSQPDYSDLQNWAASPFKEDMADRTPNPEMKNRQKEASADVFFIHPTTYTNEKGNNKWNAALDDKKLNEKTDEGSILFQASSMNGAGRIFAPRYRQAHIHVFFSKTEEEKSAAKTALDLAYADVKAAFKYYLKNHNEGRPIVIAAHSQGTIHAKNLLKEFFDEKELLDQLVVAYLVGMPIRENSFKNLDACKTPEETNCFCTWRSYQRGFLPKWHEAGSNIIVTNPLSWKTDNKYVSKEENDGTLLFKFDKGVTPGISDAQVYEDHLWVNKPKFKGSAFLTFKNYHFADYNLFYSDIRANAIKRVEVYLQK